MYRLQSHPTFDRTPLRTHRRSESWDAPELTTERLLRVVRRVSHNGLWVDSGTGSASMARWPGHATDGKSQQAVDDSLGAVPATR